MHPDHDARAIDALRRDVQTYRALALAALDALAECSAREQAAREQFQNTKAELRRYTANRMQS